MARSERPGSEHLQEIRDLRERVAELTARDEELTRLAKDLRHSQDRFARAASSSLVGVWEWDLRTNEIHIDPVLKEILGFEDHEIPNRMDEWVKRVHPDDLEYVRAAATAHIEGRTEKYECEHRMIHRNGSVRWFLARGQARRDEEGAAYAMVGSDTDITAMKRAQYEAFLHAVPDLIFRISATGTYLEWVPSREIKPFASPSEFLGRNLSDVLPEEVAGGAMEVIRRTLATGRIQTYEYGLPEEQGWREYEARVIPLREQEVLVLVRDITERRQIDAKLRESEQRLFQFLEAMPVGAFVLDSGGKAYYANQEAKKILGKGVVPDIDAAALAQTYRAYVAGSDEEYPTERMPVVRALAGEHSSVDDMEIRRPDGTVSLHVDAAPINDSEGRVAYAIAAFSDVTARKQALEALSASEERFRQVFENSPMGIAIIRPDHTIARANRTLCEILGYDEDQLTGRSVRSITHPDDIERDLELATRLFAGEISTYSLEKRYIARQGGTLWTNITASLIQDVGSPLFSRLVLVENITERKSSEEAMRRSDRLASIGTLAAGMAHEINNPLGSILVAARNAREAMGSPGGDDKLEQCLETVVRNAKRCGEIVKSVLQFSRREPTEKITTEFNPVVERAVDLTRGYAESREVELEVELSADLPRIRINPVEMEQLVVNLTRNAIESGEEGIRVTIRTRPARRGIQLRVQDNGRGMTEEQRRHIFDPFYTTRHEQGGLGLGLSIVHGIVAAHGGVMEVESVPDWGTVVTVSLPAQQDDEGAGTHLGVP